MDASRQKGLANNSGGAAATDPAGVMPQFRESWGQYLRRLILGSAYALKPSRVALLPRIWRMTLAYYF